MRFFSSHNAPSAPKTIERREQRSSTFVIVEINNEGGSLLERANLRDLSANGALISLPTRQPLPKKVTLYFVADQMQKTAQIKWQEGRSAGIEFDDPIILPERLRDRRNRVDVVASHFRRTGI